MAETIASPLATHQPGPPRALRVQVWKFVAIYVAAATVSFLITTPADGWLNWYISLVWSLYLPFTLLGLWRVTFGGRAAIKRSSFSGVTTARVIFVVATVCRHDTLPALERVIRSVVQRAPRNLLDWRLDIVVEEHAEAREALERFIADFEHVRIITVPARYQTPNDTRYKARANHYAVEQRAVAGEARSDVYVYHLDDDTHVEADTVSSIAEFIETYHGERYLAQGILTFPHELSRSWFSRWGDSIRPMDDVTRFGFFTGDRGRPWMGVHGEHLLVRADIIQEMGGWDVGDTLVEDAVFGLRFAERYPGKSAALNSFSYGASPGSIRDFLRQRRRWAIGLLQLVIKRRREFPFLMRLPMTYAVICWLLGPFQFVGVVLVLAFATGLDNTSPVALWIILLWAFNFAYFVWQYMEGLKINLRVSEAKYQQYSGIRSLAMVPLIYLFTAAEGFAALLGLLQFGRKHAPFEVISKQR